MYSFCCFFFLEIPGLSQSNNLEKKVFLSGTLDSSNFFCYFYIALDTFAPKIKFLAEQEVR